eukprot:TRINITY_DN2386_c0_g1_i1.p1 TRINITY_DN2386_c0_g1~~TRINITY_DN2386_c0_g1_i1.p1  ORF type:complete len:1531 (-),score=578.23 TRINITY_DN2386_c0_g1_i1:95-4687(-)
MAATGPTDYTGYKPKWEGEYSVEKGRARAMGSSVFGGDPNAPAASGSPGTNTPAQGGFAAFGRESMDAQAMRKRRDREHYEALKAQAEDDKMRRSYDAPLSQQQLQQQQQQQQYRDAPTPVRNGPTLAFQTPAQDQQQAPQQQQAAGQSVANAQNQFQLQLKQAGANPAVQGAQATPATNTYSPNKQHALATPQAVNSAPVTGGGAYPRGTAAAPGLPTQQSVPNLDPMLLQPLSDNMSRLQERAVITERTSNFLVDKTNKLQDEVALRSSAADERIQSLEKTVVYLTEELSNARYDLKRQLADVQTSQRQELDKLLQLYERIEQNEALLENNSNDIRRKAKQDDSDITRLEISVEQFKAQGEQQYLQARERSNKNADNIRRLQKQAEADQNELTHQIDENSRRLDTVHTQLRQNESDVRRLFDETESVSASVKRNYENIDSHFRKHENDIAEVRRTAFDQLTQAATELRSAIEETKSSLALSVENLYKTTTEMMASEREERVRREQLMQQAFEAELQRRQEKEAQDAIDINNRFAEAANELLREQELRHADQQQLRHDFNLQTADLEKTMMQMQQELQREDVVIRQHFDSEVSTIRGTVAVLEHTVQNNYTSLAEVLRAEIKSRLYSDQEAKNKFDHLVLTNQQEHQSMRADVKALEDKTRRNILKSEDRMHAALTELHSTMTDEVQQLSDETVRQIADVEVMINSVKSRIGQLDSARAKLQGQMQGQINNFVDNHKKRLKEEADAREIESVMKSLVDRVEGDAMNDHLKHQSTQNKTTVESVKRLGLVFKNLNAMVGKIGVEVKDNTEHFEEIERKIDGVSNVVVDIRKDADDRDEIKQTMSSMIDRIVAADEARRVKEVEKTTARQTQELNNALGKVDTVFDRLEVEVAQLYLAQDKLRGDVGDKVTAVADTVDEKLKDFMADQQTHIDSVGDRLESFMKTNEKAVTKNGKELIALRKDFEKLEMDVEDGLEGITKEVDETSIRLDKTEKHVALLEDTMQAKLDDNKASLQESVSQLGSIKSQDLEVYYDKVEALQKTVKKLDSEVGSKMGTIEKEFGVAYMQREELREDLEKRLTNMGSQLDAKLTEHQEQVLAKTAKAGDKLTHLGDDVGEVEDRLDQLEDTLKEWQDRTLGVGKDMLSLDERVQELGSKTDSSDRLVQKLNKQVTSNNDILQEFKSDLLGVRSIMQERLDTVTKSQEALKADVDDAIDEVRGEMKKLEEEGLVGNDGKSAVTTSTAAAPGAGSKQGGDQEVSRRLDAVEKDIKSKFTHFEQELGQVYLNAAEIKDGHKDELASIEDSIADLKKRVTKSDAVIELLEAKEDTWEDVVADKVRESTQSELKQLKNKLNKRIEEVENSVSAMSEQNSVANLTGKMEKTAKDVQALKAELAELDDALNDRLTSAKSKQDSDLRSFKNKTNERLQEVEDTLADMRNTSDQNKVRELNRKVNDLRHDVDDLLDEASKTARSNRKGNKTPKPSRHSDDENGDDNAVKLPKIPTRENTPSKSSRTDRSGRAKTPGTNRSTAR